MAIRVNLKALETMLFIWASMKDKEKLPDEFLLSLADSEEMQAAFDEEYTKDSLRKVLSSILNREKLNAPNKKESRFWNYNMWMLEDPEITQTMLAPIKQLNVDELAKDLAGDVEIVFYPGQLETYSIKGNTLFINFFHIKPDWSGEGVTIEDKSVPDFVKEKLSEM